ncbi:hypothetical protein DFR71_6434 [Nocardia alba]|uniref:Xaa-Pro dipeptidyl-peptidase C-terminal domain-containing protein n=2 Tax=Nocardia alba TaxID=225051 RepID=A0A4R1FAH1_9NOCA|nr:hypothetical protein DFR71_6434 [Nocardia alba]
MTARSWLRGRRAGLPPATRSRVRVERDVPVKMPDGISLLTDRWYSTSEGSDPIVLIRSPYGRQMVASDARLLAERGFTVIVQSCRGTFGSGGEFVPMFGEVEDTRATWEWMDAQPWAHDDVYLWGASYLGLTTWAASRAAPRPVPAMFVGVTSTDFRRSIFYPNGRFGLGTALFWRFVFHTQEQPSLKRLAAFARLIPTFRRATRAGVAEGADRRALSISDAPYQSWLDHGPTDPWWDPASLDDQLTMGPPILTFAGWHDLFIDAQIAEYEQIQAAGRSVRLIVGPWSHMSMGAHPVMIRESIDFFTTAPRPTGARIWFGGAQEFRELPSFPPATERCDWTLDGGGGLTLGAGSRSRGSRSFVTTAGNPAPALGGTTLFPPDMGSKNQKKRERRPDVLSYTSAELTDPVTIAGRPSVRLSIEGDAGPWFVRLCDVSPSGKSVNICDGVTGASPVREVEIDMSPAAHVFLPGHRLRLQVSADASPSYAAAPAGSRRTVVDEPERRSVLTLPTIAKPHS